MEFTKNTSLFIKAQPLKVKKHYSKVMLVRGCITLFVKNSHYITSKCIPVFLIRISKIGVTPPAFKSTRYSELFLNLILKCILCALASPLGFERVYINAGKQFAW